MPEMRDMRSFFDRQPNLHDVDVIAQIRVDATTMEVPVLR